MVTNMMVTISSTFVGIGEDGEAYSHFSEIEMHASEAARRLIDSAIHFAGSEGTWKVSGAFSNLDPEGVDFTFTVTAQTDVARMVWSLSRV